MNTVTISGRIETLESRYTKAGNEVNNIKLKNEQEIKDKIFSNELDVTFWGEIPPAVCEGCSVILTGYLKENKWEYEGKECSRLVVVAQNLVPIAEGNWDTADDSSETEPNTTEEVNI